MRLKAVAIFLTGIALLPGGCSPAGKQVELPISPDLTRLDPPVRTQFEQAYNRANAAILTGANAGMATAIGELGMLFHAYAYPEPALQAYRAARERHEEARWDYLYALVATDLGMTDEAESALLSAFRLDPASGVIALRLAQNYLDGGRSADALGWFKIAQEDQQLTGAALAGIGMIELNTGNPQKALASLDRAHRLIPDDASVLQSMGNAYRAIGEPDKALSLFQQASSASLLPKREFAGDPFMQRVLLMRQGHKRFDQMAMAALSQGQTDLALANYRLALDAQPDALDVRHNLALLLWRKGQKEAALAEFEQIFRRRPAFAPSRLFLAYELGAANDMRAAEKHILIVLEADPANLEAQLLYADLLDFNAQSDAALAAYQKALVLDPDVEKAWIGAVYNLIRLNRFENAGRMIDQGLARLPDSEELLRLQTQLREINKHEQAD